MHTRIKINNERNEANLFVYKHTQCKRVVHNIYTVLTSRNYRNLQHLQTFGGLQRCNMDATLRVQQLRKCKQDETEISVIIKLCKK